MESATSKIQDPVGVTQQVCHARRPSALLRRAFFAFSISSVGVGGFACGTNLGPDDLVGVYQPSRLRITDTETIDFLAEGGSLSLNLTLGGVTRGTFVIPASMSESGQEETLDLTGTYTFTDNIVRFDHAADTFIRDLEWTYSENVLQAMGTFGGTTIDVVLIRITDVPQGEG